MSLKKRFFPLITAGFFAAIPATQAVEFGAFADITYSDSSEDGTTNRFVLGGLDLYATQNIGADTRAFVEFVFEDPGDGYVIDLERLWIKRTITPAFEIGAGRFHAPLGYWNRTYHHGALIQDTVSRPSFIDFEDAENAVLPMHVIGLMASGTIDMDNGTFGYEFSVANGTSLTTDGFTTATPASPFVPGEIGVNNTSDPSEQKLIALRGTYRMKSQPLQIAVFVMDSPIAESGGNAGAVAAAGTTIVDQLVAGFDVRYERDQFDMLAEYYNIDNDDKVGAGGSHKADAYFVQLGYRITDKVKPVYRYESLSFKAADPYFQYLGRSEGARHVLGLRYDLDDSNALKLEFNNSDPDSGSSETSYHLQWAFLMF